jgi:hypothetical protein
MLERIALSVSVNILEILKWLYEAHVEPKYPSEHLQTPVSKQTPSF